MVANQTFPGGGRALVATGFAWWWQIELARWWNIARVAKVYMGTLCS